MTVARERLSLRATRRFWPTGCLGAVAMSAWWALAPLEAPDMTLPDLDVRDTSEAITIAALDVDAFRVPLLVAPPAPPEPEPAPPAPAPPAPLRLQLLAVVGGEDSYSAVLYDPEADRIVVVAPGETLAEGRVVEGVTARGVAIRDGETVRTLAVRDDARGAGTP